MRVLATAGHVDHGKSTLVRALTGTDPDRWPEEKARGLTIDLGFAAMAVPSGEELAFVDVPGHGRFIANMLAGVGSVDACLFVVSAVEGWKEQSEEHLRILELLGLRHGLVALTKVATAGPDLTELAGLEVRERTAGTFLEHAEIVAVDAPSGTGVGELIAGLGRLVSALPAPIDARRPRMWIDRRFSVRGSGTIVTGTLTGGSVGIGDEMAVVPGPHPVRIRSLQSHNSPSSVASPSRRLAVNLTGVVPAQVHRGQALVRPEQWHLSGCFDATLEALQSLDHPIERRGAFSLHVGSGHFPVRARFLGAARVEPGEEALARFWVQGGERLPLTPGDRYVLREAGRHETVGGGQILDVDPLLPTSKARPSLSWERVVAERGWVDADHLYRLTGHRESPNVSHWVVDPDVLGRGIARLEERCRAAGPAGLAIADLDERERALVRAGLPSVVVSDGRAVAAELVGHGLSPEAEEVLGVLESAKWSPPDLPLSRRAALRELQRKGLAVEAGDHWFATSAVDAAVAAIRDLLEGRPGGFTVADSRDLLGTTRKHVLPLLGHLDGAGLTRRNGDVRVAGARLADWSPAAHAAGTFPTGGDQ